MRIPTPNLPCDAKSRRHANIRATRMGCERQEAGGDRLRRRYAPHALGKWTTSDICKLTLSLGTLQLTVTFLEQSTKIVEHFVTRQTRGSCDRCTDWLQRPICQGVSVDLQPMRRMTGKCTWPTLATYVDSVLVLVLDMVEPVTVRVREGLDAERARHRVRRVLHLVRRVVARQRQ